MTSLQKSASLPIKDAAQILLDALDKIMDGDLEIPESDVDDDNEEETDEEEELEEEAEEEEDEVALPQAHANVMAAHQNYLFAISPINLLPKKNVESVLNFMLDTDFYPYKMGVDGRQIFLCYRIHLADITSESAERILDNIVDLAAKADELDNKLVEDFGCEFSLYSKV